MPGRMQDLARKKDAYHNLIVEGYRRLAGETVTPDRDESPLDPLVGEFLRMKDSGDRISIRGFCSANKLPQKRFEQKLKAFALSRTGNGTVNPVPALSPGVLEYYSRPEVQQALFQWSQGRRLALHYRQGAMRLGVRKPEDIPALVSVSDGDYPTFHASVGRYRGALLEAYELVAEVDYKGDWKACFKAVRPLVHALRSEGVTFMVKFSGHSSAHVLIPCKGLSFRPAAEAFLKRVPGGLSGCSKLDLSFRDPRHFIRMPYALHERTGLVSLPLSPEAFDAFDPVMAEPQRVVVDSGAIAKYLQADNSAWFRETF